MSDPTLKLHRGVYVVQTIEHGKRVRRSLGTSDKQEAIRRLEHIKLTNRVIDRNRQKTIEELFETYMQHLTAVGKATKPNRKLWKILSPSFGAIYPQYLTDEMCFKHCNSRAVSVGTLYTELNLLRTVLNFAYKRRLIPQPVNVYVPSKPPPKTNYITKEEFSTILEASKFDHVRLFLILGVTTGARSNAILDLTWDRVDLHKRTIDLRIPGTPTNKGRAIVPINDTAYRYLTKALEVRRTPFVIEYGGDRIHRVSSAIARTSKRIGIYVTPHMLRHSAAVWMAEGGVPMSEIAQYLGHSNTAITERVYARYSPGYLRKAASHLEIEM